MREPWFPHNIGSFMNLEQHRIVQELYTTLEKDRIICHECATILRKRTLSIFYNNPVEVSITLHTQCIHQLFVAFTGVLNLPDTFRF